MAYLLFQDAARAKIAQGIDKLANTVSQTLGPRGRYVVIGQQNGPPIITNDGVTVAESISLEDPYENMGARLMQEAARRTDERVGDGTTTATILAQSMIHAGLKQLAAGANPVEMRRGMEKTLQRVEEQLIMQAVPIENQEDLATVSAISARDADIGRSVAQALESVGVHGAIKIEEGPRMGIELELISGMQFDKGYMSPHFTTDGLVADLVNPLIMISAQKINQAQDIVGALEIAHQTGRPLMILAEDFSTEIIAALMLNRQHNNILSVCVRAPYFGERRRNFLQDIAMISGAEVFGDERKISLQHMSIDLLGEAERITVTAETTLIEKGKGSQDLVAQKLAQLSEEFMQTTDAYEQDILRERIGKLDRGIGILRVGGFTETEVRERIYLVEDALSCARSALEGGIVCGGGLALLKVQVDTDDLYGDEQLGGKILLEALKRPLMQIADNAGYEGLYIVHETLLREGNIGFDANTGEYVDMFEAGIIDPLAVVIAALKNATSVSKNILTIECAVTGQN